MKKNIERTAICPSTTDHSLYFKGNRSRLSTKVTETVMSTAKNPTIERTYGNIFAASRDPRNTYVTRNVKSPPRNPAAILPILARATESISTFAGPSKSSLEIPEKLVL